MIDIFNHGMTRVINHLLHLYSSTLRIIPNPASGVSAKSGCLSPRKRRRAEQEEQPTKDEGLGGEKNEGLSPTTDRLSRLRERSSPATAFHSHPRGGLSAKTMAFPFMNPPSSSPKGFRERQYVHLSSAKGKDSAMEETSPAAESPDSSKKDDLTCAKGFNSRMNPASTSAEGIGGKTNQTNEINHNILTVIIAPMTFSRVCGVWDRADVLFDPGVAANANMG